MAATGSKISRHGTGPLTYGIVYGLFGRLSQSHRLDEFLTAQGLKPADSIDEADILIAHSAGCWLIPRQAKARLVICNGAPLAEDRGRTYRKANLEIYKNFSTGRALKHMILNTYYGLRHIRRNLAIIRMPEDAGLVILPGASYVFIANRHDPWPVSRKLDEFLETKDWAFIGMPGSHANIWWHPEDYAPIIVHYARLLEKAGD